MSDERFVAFAQTLGDGLFVLDRERHIVFVNTALASLFGYEPGDLIGEPFTVLVPEDADAPLEGAARCLPDPGRADIAPHRVEVRGLRRDGSSMPLDISCGTYEQDGQPFVTGVVRDATERQRAESRVRFQARLLDAVEEAVVVTDLGGRILYWNAYAERLYGWPAAEVIGRRIHDVTPSDLSRRFGPDIKERLGRGETWTGELHVRDRDGREFPVLVTDSPMMDGEGRLAAIIGTSKEITDRRRSEEAQRFLAEAGRVLSWSLDHAATLSRVSRLAVPMLGEWCVVELAEDGELVPVEHCAPDGREDSGPQLVDVLAGEDGVLSRVPARPEPTRVLATDPVLTDADRSVLDELGIGELLLVPLEVRGERQGMMAFARQAPDRPYDEHDTHLAAELALRAASAIENARLYRDADESNRAKTDFLAVVSHELRTPLNAIMGYADLLTAGVSGPLNEKQRAQIERVKVGASHLAHLIDEVLAYARVEGGRDAVEVEEVDVGRIAREAAVVIQPLAADKGLDLGVDAPPAGPELQSDSGKIRQILVNLLSNAVKYTENGNVRVEVRTEDDGAVIRVSDTGIGIPREEHERIFEPFRQVQSPNTRTVGGTGLGLSVNRRLVDLLGGTISVESEPGRGSTFTVRLPARVARVPGRPTARRDP